MRKVKVISVKREVIEGQLLAALDDKSKVAILANEDDCRILIYALERGTNWSVDDTLKRHELADGLKRLMTEAFDGPLESKT